MHGAFRSRAKVRSTWGERAIMRSLTIALLIIIIVTLHGGVYARSLALAGETFVIDPGHGTRYPDGSALNVGAVAPSGLREMDITLRVGERLAALLRRSGARVVLTRSFAHPYRTGTNKAHDNRARAALANRLGATAFLAIHCDASTSVEKRGTSVFWLKPNSASFASNVRAALAPLGLGESEFRARDLAVTSEARVPALLVELGFVTNPAQGTLLADAALEEREAAALAAAITATFGRPRGEAG